MQPLKKKKGIKKLCKKVALVDENDNIIELYDSLQETSDLNNFSNSGTIWKKINKQSVFYKNGQKYYFKYYDQPDLEDDIWYEPKESEEWNKLFSKSVLKYSNKGRILDSYYRKTKGGKQKYQTKKYRKFGGEYMHRIIFLAHNGYMANIVCHDDKLPLDEYGCAYNYPDSLRDDTQKNNIRESCINGDMNKICKKIKVIDIENNKEYIFYSCAEAERELKLGKSSISSTLTRGKKKLYKNKYKFEYI